jgi:hypothetical protein
MEPFATPGDVQAIWHPLSADETNTVMSWINEASQLVRDSVPLVAGFDIDERIAVGSLDESTVRSVVAQMVRRVMLNPYGDSSVTEQTGPFSVTRTKANGMSSGGLYLSPSEMRRLLGRRTLGQVAFTITPGPGPVFT